MTLAFKGVVKCAEKSLRFSLSVGYVVTLWHCVLLDGRDNMKNILIIITVILISGCVSTNNKQAKTIDINNFYKANFYINYTKSELDARHAVIPGMNLFNMVASVYENSEEQEIKEFISKDNLKYLFERSSKNFNSHEGKNIGVSIFEGAKSTSLIKNGDSNAITFFLTPKFYYTSSKLRLLNVIDCEAWIKNGDSAELVYANRIYIQSKPIKAFGSTPTNDSVKLKKEILTYLEDGKDKDEFEARIGVVINAEDNEMLSRHLWLKNNGEVLKQAYNVNIREIFDILRYETELSTSPEVLSRNLIKTNQGRDWYRLIGSNNVVSTDSSEAILEVDNIIRLN
ncbi:hypothetical protein L2750_17420 [Shewanella submarina]|uniref:Uncharacterized protein n=1 Tax=Shewanella submarina TaxID=2016376 RepID=A0ABV7GBP2_9GAMM|nr:hypothetical protein [Shewanella submarina]MCL1038912.1 hypothetical protein [Shewanella submarina]